MLELAHDLLPLLRAGRSAAVVTVTRVARSAPRGVGTSMVVTADARVVGSLSSGCVEGDAVLLALDALATGETRRATFGVVAVPDGGGRVRRAARPSSWPGPASRAAVRSTCWPTGSLRRTAR
ncbi:hypothetical protein C8046_14585 [Serinibacter arcticus]|uniref:XdhC- CoxI domain-containing protein n=1 Tax=Serinibacter arcticus TaxID=1655435 RepID=A0A2U1ZXJ6_9MICO|nr:XdhC family protein [Serinibacter arcticus]PWD51691.1 hypothetical protein C8046_14585 [Serinibacter arcticus]